MRPRIGYQIGPFGLLLLGFMFIGFLYAYVVWFAILLTVLLVLKGIRMLWRINARVDAPPYGRHRGQ